MICSRLDWERSSTFGSISNDLQIMFTRFLDLKPLIVGGLWILCECADTKSVPHSVEDAEMVDVAIHSRASSLIQSPVDLNIFYTAWNITANFWDLFEEQMFELVLEDTWRMHKASNFIRDYTV